MNVKEKILLVQLLLEDIRGNWNDYAEERAVKAKSLCEEIAKENNNSEFLILADFCDTYINSSKRWGDWDGRFFRQKFPMGYENMNNLHGLKSTYRNKSKDFQTTAKEYLTYPQFRFNDWEEVVNDD